jgi:Kef-type K+ transport system membrane component KefB
MPHLESSDLSALLLQIAVIVFVSRALGIVTRWLGQPLVIAEVLAGILLGPSLLGWLAPSGMTALFPPPTLPTLKLLSQVGLVLFMFLIGLELDPKLLRGRTHTSVVISHTSIVVPFGLGAIMAWWLYDVYSEPTVPYLSFVLFLGVSLSVTAFPVLARILSERQLLSSRVGAIAIACAAVDDVTAWCLLALVVAVARSAGIISAVWTTGFAVAFILLMLFLVRPFMRRIGARVANRDGLTSTVMAGIFILLILSSITSELIGIHALFGAFLFGAILPKDGKLAETLIEKLESVSVVLFLPLFFAYSGLRTQIALVSQPSEWLVTGLLICAATVGKFGGSALAGRLTGLRWREASAIGVLMNTRGLMELIVLNIGLDIGVISPTVFTMLVIMALVTTFATTPILAWVYPDHELARDRLVAPGPVLPGQPDPYTVMMCVSDRNPGTGLLLVTSALLGHRREATRVLALHLRRPIDRPSVEQRRASGSSEASALAGLLASSSQLMLEVEPLEFVSTDVGKDICRTAEAVHARVILVNAHKPLLLEGDFGGIVGHVTSHSSSSVGVFVDRGLKKVDKILVCVLGDADDAAVSQLVRVLVTTPSVSVTLLRADSERARASQTEDPTSPEVPRAPIRTMFAHPSLIGEVTLQEAAHGYDLVIVSVQQGPAASSDRSRQIVRSCPSSVLVFHHCAERRAEVVLNATFAESTS